jgi:hypothetical protein
MLLMPARRRTLMARLRREAMMRGPLPVRIWERSSSKVTVADRSRMATGVLTSESGETPRPSMMTYDSSTAAACSGVKTSRLVRMKE